jgi:hypothetical protein
MAAITLGEILKHAEDFETMLGNFYARLSQKTSHEGVRLLTEYMSRHTHHIHKLLEDLSPNRKKKLCSTPLPLKPHFPGKDNIDLAHLSEDPTASDVLDAAIGFDEELVQMYHSIADQPVSQDIKDFFEALVRSLERDEIELKKIKAMNYF